MVGARQQSQALGTVGGMFSGRGSNTGNTAESSYWGNTGYSPAPQLPALPAFPAFPSSLNTPSVTPAAPVPVNTSTEPNPQLMQTLGSIRDYRGQLGAGSDVDAINAMQRQRDYASGQAKEASASAGARGFAPGTGVNALMQERARRSGTMAAGQVNAANVSDARNKQLSALGLESGAANSVASNQLGAGQLALGAYTAAAGANNAAAQLQALQQQRNTELMMSLMNMYTGA